MRRFFRPADVAALPAAAIIAIAMIAAPSVNRLSAQDLAPSSGDSVIVRETMAARDTAGPGMDLRALSANVAAPTASSAATASAGASVNGLRSAVHARESTAPLQVNAAKQGNLGQPVALMVVGGAALVVGAIIGDDPGTIIMVGGAIVGLYGLYQYLQ
jgi:hypothetical protein